MTRKRGAPPGNLNAFKHGFYSRFFNTGEITDIQAIAPDLTAEIAMLRVVARRLFERLSTMETGDVINIDDYSSLVGLLSSSSVRLASLMRINHFLTGKSTDLGEALMEALSVVVQEQNLS